MALRDLYRKARWQASGSNFYGLRLLFEKHCAEQEHLMDALAERVQTLGSVARALARDVVEETRLARGPSGVESAVDQLQRLVDAHEFLLRETRPVAREAAAGGDNGSNDLVIGQVVRGNELQSRFVLRHLIPHRDAHGPIVAGHLPPARDTAENFALAPSDHGRPAP